MDGVSKSLIEWDNAFNLPFDESELDGAKIDDQLDLNNALVNGFADTAFFAFSEQGCPPHDYLPDIVDGYLSQITEKNMECLGVNSDDGWQSARVIISSGNEQIELLLTHVDNLDWVPPSVAEQMGDFSRTYCEKRLYTLVGDDPFVVLYLPEEAILAIEAIRNQLPKNKYLS